MKADTRESFTEFLLNEGAETSTAIVSSGDFTSIGVILMNQRGPLTRSLRLLLSHTDTVYDSPKEVIQGDLSVFGGTSEDFTLLQQHLCPGFYQMAYWTRVCVAIRVTSLTFRGFCTPELMKTILKDIPLTTENLLLVCFDHDGMETTLVHSIARTIGGILAALDLCHFKGDLRMGWAYLTRTEQEDFRRLYDSWTQFFRVFLAAGVEMSQIVGNLTPHASFLEGYLRWWAVQTESPAPHWREALRTWFQFLQDAGVDLGSVPSKLGQSEEDMWRREEIAHVKEMLKYNFHVTMSSWAIDQSWKEIEGYAGDFWVMIERPIELMPGAWPDE